MALQDLMADFRGQIATPDTTVQPATTVQTPVVPGAAPDAGTNTNTTNVATTTEPASPLDQFSKLWEDDPNKTPAEQFGVLGEINAQKIMEVAGKVNFAQVVKKEDLAAIKNGGDEALNALGRALNSVSQATYGQSALAASKLIEQASTKIEEKILSTLPDKIKHLSFSNSLREENPAYAHPAAAPIVQMIETQMATKYPNATTSELKQMAQDYFTRTFSAISGADKQAAEEANRKSANEIDWAKEFGVT